MIIKRLIYSVRLYTGWRDGMFIVYNQHEAANCEEPIPNVEWLLTACLYFMYNIKGKQLLIVKSISVGKLSPWTVRRY